MPTIDELKLKLVQARDKYNFAKLSADAHWELVEESNEHKEYMQFLAGQSNAATALEIADKELREAALAVGGSGEISPGVKIQFRHEVRYELEKVIEWAKTEARNLFVFDEKAFKSAAKKGTLHGAPFEKYDEPYVTLATQNKDFQIPA